MVTRVPPPSAFASSNVPLCMVTISSQTARPMHAPICAWMDSAIQIAIHGSSMSVMFVLSLFAIAYGVGSGLGEVGEGLKEIARAMGRAGRG